MGLAAIGYIVGLGARDKGAMEEGLFRQKFLQWSDSWLRTRISINVFDFSSIWFFAYVISGFTLERLRASKAVSEPADADRPVVEMVVL